MGKEWWMTGGMGTYCLMNAEFQFNAMTILQRCTSMTNAPTSNMCT